MSSLRAWPLPVLVTPPLKIPAHQRPAPKPVNDTVHDAKPRVTAPLTRLALDNDRITQLQIPASRASAGSFPNRAGSTQVLVSCDQKPRPHRSRTDPMDDALEARSQRLCHHLQRPLAGRRNLLNENAGNTVNETVPSLDVPESGTSESERCRSHRSDDENQPCKRGVRAS